jgi:nucleotide-binding universal stress UspA family protein
VDFVKLSLDVLPSAIDLARNSKAQLTLVHVVEPFHADMYMDTTQSQRGTRAAARQRLNKLTENTKKTWSRTGYDLRSGHPVTSIASLAKRTNADLIVMGTHGRSGILRYFIGSVAERVVRHAPCSVLVVR